MNKAYADIHGLPAGFPSFPQQDQPSFPGGYQQGYHPCGFRTIHTAVASFNLNSLIAQDAMASISEPREEAMDFRAAAGADIASRGLMAADSAGRPGGHGGFRQVFG
ncbi:hypothetical protein [Bacillus atrophaeus]|uniref:hypothetical protein n=1 Tax=Bacillus atrophaeus TaxID=1452 RepID=UPI002DBEE8DE|nr:hypothetical protein [Bacillus atrophaeus]MEC0694183.1 hypothetical protein [Bacillus atrophaeus]